MKTILTIVVSLAVVLQSKGQNHSVAKQWNNVLLKAIENDFARPPVHARNLFHVSIAMYDAWAVYDDTAKTFLLGKNVGKFSCFYTPIKKPQNIRKAREESLSYAAYRLIRHRFTQSPGWKKTSEDCNNLMMELGYDTTFVSSEYSKGLPAALGNYIAEKIIDFGLQDGSNESDNYRIKHYKPFNPPFKPLFHGNLTLRDPKDLNSQTKEAVSKGQPLFFW